MSTTQHQTRAMADDDNNMANKRIPLGCWLSVAMPQEGPRTTEESHPVIHCCYHPQQRRRRQWDMARNENEHSWAEVTSTSNCSLVFLCPKNSCVVSSVYVVLYPRYTSTNSRRRRLWATWIMKTKGCGGGWLFAKIGSNRNSCIFQNEHGEYFQRALVSSFGKARWYLWGRQVNIMKPRSYKVFANKHFAWKFKLWNIGNNNSRRLFSRHVLSLKRFSFVLFLVL